MVERRITYVKPHPPYELAQFDTHIRAAVAAVAAGTAESGQQMAAMHWVLFDLCGTYQQGYFPDSARDSDFAAGKRWVGLQLAGLINFKVVEQKEHQS